jgi:hypothetical protein
MPTALRPNLPGFQRVTDHYNACHNEETRTASIRVDQTITFGLTFQDLVRRMVALKEKRYVVVTHGTDGGIALPIIAKTRVIPQDDDLEALIELADERKRTLEDNEKIDSDWLKNEVIHRWQITGMPTITEADMLQLADDVLAVRKLKLEQLEIRGCHTGKLLRILRLLRDLFGAQSISAPMVDMFFIDIRPMTGPNAVHQLQVQPILGGHPKPTIEGHFKTDQW